MNKTELVETIAQRTDIAKKDVQSVLDTFEDIAGEIVAKGKEALTIPGFLKFEQTRRAGEVVDILQIPAFLCRQTDLLIAAGDRSTLCRCGGHSVMLNMWKLSIR